MKVSTPIFRVKNIDTSHNSAEITGDNDELFTPDLHDISGLIGSYSIAQTYRTIMNYVPKKPTKPFPEFEVMTTYIYNIVGISAHNSK